MARTFAKSSSNANETSLVRLDPYGNVAWSHRPGGDTTDFVEVAAMTRISAMTTDAGGNVYIAGPTATGNRLESFRRPFFVCSVADRPVAADDRPQSGT